MAIRSFASLTCRRRGRSHELFSNLTLVVVPLSLSDPPSRLCWMLKVFVFLLIGIRSLSAIPRIWLSTSLDLFRLPNLPSQKDASRERPLFAHLPLDQSTSPLSPVSPTIVFKTKPNQFHTSSPFLPRIISNHHIPLLFSLSRLSQKWPTTARRRRSSNSSSSSPSSLSSQQQTLCPR